MPHWHGESDSGPESAELERTLAELRRREAQLAEAQAIVHLGSWTWEIDTNLVSWSDELHRIYGVDPSHFRPTYEGFIELVHPDDRQFVRAAVERALHDKARFAFEHRILRPNGELRWLQGRGRVVVSSAGRPVRMAGTAHDITERKAGEEARLRLLEEQIARKFAEQAVQARDQFLSMASHELRTPLTPLHLQLESVERSMVLHSVPRQLRESVQLAIKQVLRLERLVDDLLDLSHIAAGHLELRTEAVNLAEVVREVAECLADDAMAQRCELRLQLVDPVVGWWDPVRLQQVVSNLVSTALKYGAGKPVELSVHRYLDRAQVSVRDHGDGIPPEHAAVVFGRNEGIALHGCGGLGLGLYLARQVVEAHAGSIKLASKVGTGTCFTVDLPVQMTPGS
jgi:PAS domain S-box-containing protein